MAKHLVIGAGVIGSLVAEELADTGHEVRLVSRRGFGPDRAGIERVAADASSPTDMARLAEGCAAIVNCVNAPYHRWPTDWPPIAAAVLAAAETSGAVLVTLSNLYAYGPVDRPMRPDTPLAATYAKAVVRAHVWRDAKAAHEAGRVRATEVRASDYIGPRAESAMGTRVLKRVLAGKAVQVLGATDQPHSWSFTEDVAHALVTCALDERAWGLAWHAPTNAPRTQREVIDDLCDGAGVKRVAVKTMPSLMLRMGGLFSPFVRELPKTLYQFERPFIVDDTATRTELGLEPTPWARVVKRTVDDHRAG